MPHFFVDDSFSDSKEVLSIPARHRLAAVGLWTLCGSWSAGKLTDGFVPDEVVKMLAPRSPAVVQALIDSTLWERVGGGIQFTNWDKWQRTRQQVIEYRAWDAERKRKRRAASTTRRQSVDEVSQASDELFDGDYDDSSQDAPPEKSPTRRKGKTSPRDSHRDAAERPQGSPRTPVPTPERTTYVGTEHSPNVGGDERGLTAPVSVSASRLVATVIPDKFPAAVRTALRLKASELITGDGVSADDVSDGLRRWLATPGAGPGLLPHLVADVQRERTTAATNGKPKSKVRAYAELAAEVRAQEQAALNTTSRKELN